MTTIAYDGKTVSADGRITQSEMIVSDDFCKFYKINDSCWAAMAGATTEIRQFLSELNAGGEPTKNYTCHGFIIEVNGTVSEVYSSAKKYKIDEYEFIKEDLSFHDYNGKLIRSMDASGSGRDFAYAAMDFGWNSREAVEYAAKRDPATGGRVLTFDVEKFEFISYER